MGLHTYRRLLHPTTMSTFATGLSAQQWPSGRSLRFPPSCAKENPEMTDQDVLTARRPLIMDRYPAWQQDSVDEIIDLLEQKTGG